jgi:hypothetical protein
VTTSLPQAGWYPDPSGTSEQYYWDGQHWTHLGAETPPPQQLPAAVRERILTDALNAHIAANTRNVRGAIARDSSGRALPGGSGPPPSGGTVQRFDSQKCYVRIKEREPLRAVVYDGSPVYPYGYATFPTTVVKFAVLSVFSCGLFLPLWVFVLYKKPPVFTWTVDEYGAVTTTQNEIGKTQRIHRWIVLGITALWLYALVTGGLGPFIHAISPG